VPLPQARWTGTVYHGILEDLFVPNLAPEGYLAFLGRIAPEKGPETAIHLARAAGLPLKIAAKVDKADREYFKERVEPLIDGDQIQHIGEIDERQKQAFLGNAAALLFPICWPEPFGLVMVEAMACGTPVIAFRAGSVPEIINDGLTGFVLTRQSPRSVGSGTLTGKACASALSNASQRAAWPRITSACMKAYSHKFQAPSRFNRARPANQGASNSHSVN